MDRVVAIKELIEKADVEVAQEVYGYVVIERLKGT